MKRIISKMGMLSVLNTLLSADKRNVPSQLLEIKESSIVGKFIYIENFSIDYDTNSYKLEVKNEQQYEKLRSLLVDKFPIALELERNYLQSGIFCKMLYKGEVIEVTISVQNNVIPVI